MRRRALVVLAILAALLGAPSGASAAQNSLLPVSPAASPTSGTPSTTFTFRVAYDGRWPASGVRASVAGLDRGMALTTGSATDGTWAVSTTLPSGTWQVTFAAIVLQGNAPTLAGPVVVVGGAVASAAPDSGGGGWPSPDAPLGPGTPPATTPAPAPASPTPGPSSPVGDGAPVSSAVPGASPVPVGEGAPVATDDGATAGVEPEDTGSASADSSVAPASGASNAPAAASPASTDEKGPSTIGRGTSWPAGVQDRSAPSLLDTVLLVGLSGVAAVALIGSAALLGGRRRASTGADAGSDGAAGAAEGIEAVLDRRARRRARMRLEDDPIMTAMGIDDAPRHGRRRAQQTGSGPGERPPPT
jgi:hypothetical protein